MGILVLSPTATSAASIHLFQSQQQSPPPPPLLRVRGVFSSARRGSEGGEAFSISTRTRICFPQRRRQLLFFRLKSSVESSSIVDDGLQNFGVVPSNVLWTEKEQVKAVLTMFLKKEIGLSTEATAATISNSVHFIDHLVARLHSIHKTRYLVGRKITTLEIRDALIPYLVYICEEHGDSLDDFMENFQNPPDNEREDNRDSLEDNVENSPNPPEEELQQHISEASATKLPPLDSKKLKAMAWMTTIGTDGQLPSVTLYLIDIGLDMNQIKELARRYPSITFPGWGRKVRPLVEFLLDLGMPPSVIPTILYRAPNLCTLSLSKNIIPFMAYLETLGVDKSKWAKVIHRSPRLLSYSRQKVEAIVDYLYELGLSRDRIGKVLTRYPAIVGSRVDDNLRFKAEYFQSMGVNLISLFSRFPEVFLLSIECKLKPVTQFFLDKGYSIDEIGTMASRHGIMYTLSLTNNLIPKWDFFVTMGYPRLELVRYPVYFTYSLERRIKPRYSQMRECGGKSSLSGLLGPSDSEFEKFLNRCMKKGLAAQADFIHVTSDNDRQ